MDTKEKAELKDIKNDLLNDEKALKERILDRAKDRRNINTKDYWETGYEILQSLAEQHVFYVLDKYIENNDLERACQYFAYSFSEYHGFDVPDKEEIKEEIEFARSVLPILMQIKARRTILDVYAEYMRKDIRDLEHIIDIKRELWDISKELKKK